MGRTRPLHALVRAAPGNLSQGRGRRALVLGGGPCRAPVGALLPIPARGAPAAAGVHLDVRSDGGLESRVTVEMTASSGGTDLVLTHSGLPNDEMGRGHEEGWTKITGILAAKIEGRR